MLFRSLFLIPAMWLPISGHAEESTSIQATSGTPDFVTWDANAWEPASGLSFWRQERSSGLRRSPEARNTDRSPQPQSSVRSTAPLRPFSSRQTGK